MDINIELEHIFKESLTKGINLFVVSGFSILAKDGSNKLLPTSDQLKTAFIAEFSCSTLANLSLKE